MKTLPCLFALCFLGCAADAGPSGTVDATEIKGGSPATTTYAEAAFVDTPTSFCSGALVSRRIVVTAGHCVTASRFTVTVPAVNRRATASKKWTDYRPIPGSVNPDAVDVAVIVLDTPIELPTYPKLASDPAADGTKAVNVGRMRNGQPSTMMFKGEPVSLEQSIGYPFAYETPAVAEHGDSGGPVYVGTGIGRTIVAVNSGATDEVQILARVDLVRDQIRRMIAQNP